MVPMHKLKPGMSRMLPVRAGLGWPTFEGKAGVDDKGAEGR